MFLQPRQEAHSPDLSAFRTGGYEAADSDDRLWAAAELWETTGDASVLRDSEKRLDFAKSGSGASSLAVDADWDWGNVRNLGVFTYLRSKRSGRDAAPVAREPRAPSAQGRPEPDRGRAIGRDGRVLAGDRGAAPRWAATIVGQLHYRRSR